MVNTAMCHQVIQCRDGSKVGDLTGKPLTVSLIFCPILSCRVSGMCPICFIYMACFLTLHNVFACPWVTRRTLSQMHLAHFAECLHQCLTVSYRACSAVICNASLLLGGSGHAVVWTLNHCTVHAV